MAEYTRTRAPATLHHILVTLSNLAKGSNVSVCATWCRARSQYTPRSGGCLVVLLSPKIQPGRFGVRTRYASIFNFSPAGRMVLRLVPHYLRYIARVTAMSLRLAGHQRKTRRVQADAHASLRSSHQHGEPCFYHLVPGALHSARFLSRYSVIVFAPTYGRRPGRLDTGK
jgi:hypothetical protein